MYIESVEISAIGDKVTALINGKRIERITSLQFEKKGSELPKIILNADVCRMTTKIDNKEETKEEIPMNAASYELCRSYKESADNFRRLYYSQYSKSDFYKTLLKISVAINVVLAIIIFLK